MAPAIKKEKKEDVSVEEEEQMEIDENSEVEEQEEEEENSDEDMDDEPDVVVSDDKLEIVCSNPPQLETCLICII